MSAEPSSRPKAMTMLYPAFDARNAIPTIRLSPRADQQSRTSPASELEFGIFRSGSFPHSLAVARAVDRIRLCAKSPATADVPPLDPVRLLGSTASVSGALISVFADGTGAEYSCWNSLGWRMK